MKFEEIKDKSNKAKFWLCLALSWFLFLGSFAHSFIQYEVGFTNPQWLVTDASDDIENSHSYSHSHDIDTEDFVEGSPHLHKHNPLDHSHEQPIIISSMEDAQLVYDSQQLTQTLHSMFSRYSSVLERPPRHNFLINLS